MIVILGVGVFLMLLMWNDGCTLCLNDCNIRCMGIFNANNV